VRAKGTLILPYVARVENADNRDKRE